MNETLKFEFEGDIVNLYNLFNPIQYLEVRESKTSCLLGYLSFSCHLSENFIVKIPLKAKFDFEDNYPTCYNATQHQEFRELRVRTAFNCKGHPIFKYLEADFNDWEDVVKAKKNKLLMNGVNYIRLS